MQSEIKYFRLSDDLLEIGKSLFLKPLPHQGASDLFVGYVRNQNHGRPVKAIEYDAHTPFALKTFEEIAQETNLKWGEDLQIEIVHRTGMVYVGEISVLIHVFSPHRENAFLASRYIIEEIKKKAPIWKKEYYEDGETQWLAGHSLV